MNILTKRFGHKKWGFTLIELLVVIVIIGILATISTATFKQYFGKARDAARNTTVANITLMMKVDGADDWQDTKYVYTPETLQDLFDANDYRGPKGENNICYFIGMARGADVVGDDNQFAVATWGEEYSTNQATVGGVIVDGTSQAVANVREEAGRASSSLTRADFACTPAFADVVTAFQNGDTTTPGTDSAAITDNTGTFPTPLYIDADGVITNVP